MNFNNYLNFKILDIVRAKRTKTYFPQKNIGMYLISCRLKGETVFFHGEEIFTLKPNDVFYVPIGSHYSQSDKNDVEFICLHLEIYGSYPDKMILIHPQAPQEICNLFCQVHDLWQKKPQNYIYLCMSLIYRIIALTYTLENDYESSNHNILDPALKYINMHLFLPDLSLDTASGAAGISRVYFNKLFKETFGTTPIKYINHKRIEKAKLLLKSGSYTKEEISSFCGFNDVKYFYTVFKNITGTTTGEYCRRL